MQLGHVSVASIIGMGVSVIISIGLPVFLMLFLKFKAKAKVNFFFIGAAIFVVFALMLEQCCHLAVLGLTGDVIQKNLWLYALYAGLAAAVFEETGRLVAMKFFMNRRKVKMDNTNAFMYGIGHGGAESILLVGITCINNLTTSIMLNSGQLEASLNALDTETKNQAIAGIQQLVELPALSFYMAGLERIFAIIIQIALSIIMYQAVKYGKKKLILLAYVAHFLVDAITVIATQFLNMIAVECLIASMTGAVGVCAYMIWQKYEKGEE